MNTFEISRFIIIVVMLILLIVRSLPSKQIMVNQKLILGFIAGWFIMIIGYGLILLTYTK